MLIYSIFQHILVNYLDDLVSKLEQIMNSKFQEMVEHGRKLVLMQIVTTVASVADAAEKKFLPYYDRCVYFVYIDSQF